MPVTIASNYENYTQFQKLIMQYLLPAQYTAEDICKLWVDPIRRDTIGRLPFLMMPLTYSEVSNKVLTKDFEATFPNLPFDFMRTDNISMSDSGNQLLPDFAAIASEVEGRVSQASTYVLPNNEEAESLRFFLRAIQISDPEVPIVGNLSTFSRETRVINYVDPQPNMINIDLIMYNTYSSPWADVFKSLIEYYNKKTLNGNDKGLQLHVPLAIGDAKEDNIIYQVFDCDLTGFSLGSRTTDRTQIRLALLLKKKTRTKILVGGFGA